MESLVTVGASFDALTLTGIGTIITFAAIFAICICKSCSFCNN